MQKSLHKQIWNQEHNIHHEELRVDNIFRHYSIAYNNNKSLMKNPEQKK